MLTVAQDDVQPPPPSPTTVNLESKFSMTEDYNAMRLDKSLADIVILVDESKTPIYAHSVILSHRSEYYKKALSTRWIKNQDRTALLEGIALPADLDPQHIRAVLTHPDTDVETLNILLEYIYTGSACVPESQLSSVALFADYISMDDVKLQCLAYWNMHLLKGENALDFYALAVRLGEKEYQARALLCWGKTNTLWNQPSGSNILQHMDEQDIKTLILCDLFDCWQKWSILIHWSKLRQGIPFEDVKLGVSAAFNINAAYNDINRLLHLVGLYKMTRPDFENLVKPYLSMLPKDLQENLIEHYEVSGATKEWSHQIISDIMPNSMFDDLILELEKYLDRKFSVDVNVLACNSMGDTMVLIKTVKGAILGGFVDTPWRDYNHVSEAKEAVLFRVNTRMSEVDVEFFDPLNLAQSVGYKLMGNNKEACGPCFGASLYLFGLTLCSKWGSTYETNGKTAKALLGKCTESPAKSGRYETKIEMYEVFQLTFKDPEAIVID
ncbi:hypothetical protein HDU79_005590 [Rhizoclosmatium sp. JEL0117]|nr:hypothetical protein HDU79_005590 [Rhizoclosmatium sp. JEL0117]